MRRRLLIILALLLLLAPVALVVTVLYTQTGTAMLAAQLERLAKLGLHFEGISGTLGGTLRIERFELDHPRVHIVSRGIVLTPQLRGLMLQTLQVGSLSARETSVELREDPRPPTDLPLRFLPPFLRVHARAVSLDHVRYLHTNGLEFEADTVRGEAIITPDLIRVPQFKIDGTQFDAIGDMRLHAARPMGLEIDADGHLRLPGNPQLALKAQLGGNIDVMTIKAQLREPDVATADLVMTRPEQKWLLKGKVASPAFSLDPWIVNSPLSLQRVALDVELGPPMDAHIRGSVVVPEFDDQDLLVEMRGALANRKLRIDESTVGFRDLPGKLLTTGTLLFDGGPPTLDVTAQWTNLQWPLRKPALVRSSAGDLALRGPLPYDFQVTGSVAGPNFPSATAAGSGVLTKESIEFASYSLSVLQGSMTGKAALQFDLPRPWSLSTRAEAIDPAGIFPDFPGRLSFVANGTGTGLTLAALFNANITEINGKLRDQSIRGSGAVARDAKGWQVSNADVRYGDAHLTLDGTWRDTIDARWAFTAPSLQRLLPQASGALTFSGTASGPPKTPHVVAKLDGTDLRYQDWTATHLSLDGDVDAAGQQPSHLKASASRLGQGTPFVESLNISGEGTAAGHRITIDAAGVPARTGAAAPTATMVVNGKLDRETWNATIATTQFVIAEPMQRVAIAEPATMMLSRERAALDNLCLVVAAGRLCGSGKWERDGPWEGTVAGYEIPLAIVLPPSGNEAEYAGRIEGRVHASGLPGKPWTGEAGMRIVDAAIVYTPQGAEPETLQLGNGGLAATATAERVEFSFGVQAFTDTFLYANARLQRDGSNNLLHVPLTGDIRARAGDANILPLAFPDIDHAAGVLTANANITGSLASPEVNGRIQLENGEFDSYRVNLALRQINLRADIANNGLDFTGKGRAGDGELDLDGRFRWQDRQSSGTLHLSGNNLLVADLPEYRVVASPDLQFKIDGNRVDASGDVTIPSALVQPAQLTGAVRASPDARYADEKEEERASRYVVHADIRIKMGDDVRVDAFGLQGRINGGVNTITTTGEDPIGRGELNVAEGRYEAYGQKLAINRGRLLFESSPLDDPGLDIEARREIETITVGLNVRGTLQEPRISFFSDPSMPQTQIVSYLLAGKPMDSIQSGDTSSVNSARSALAMQGGGLIASQLGRRLGLEEVGVENSIGNSGETNTALVLGKFLSPRLFISYGISLTESINTLKLRYTLSDRWVLKTEAGENQSADVEFSIER